MSRRLPPQPEADDAGRPRRDVAAESPLPSDPCHLLRLACQMADYDPVDRCEASEARVLQTLLARSRDAPPSGAA
jgi:hypothetical protein